MYQVDLATIKSRTNFLYPFRLSAGENCGILAGMTTNLHDSAYKKLFSNRTIFRQLVETFLEGQAWVKELDFSTSETLDKSFISDHYKATESALIYR